MMCCWGVEVLDVGVNGSEREEDDEKLPLVEGQDDAKD